MALAPPLSYAWAISNGSKFSRIIPLEGEAFFTSEIILYGSSLVAFKYGITSLGALALYASERPNQSSENSFSLLPNLLLFF